MRINNFFVPQLTVGPSEAKPEVAAKGDAAGTPAPQPGLHSLSAELVGLIGRVNQEPEVRPDLVAQAKQKLAEGVYSSPSSAAQTAAAILQARD